MVVNVSYFVCLIHFVPVVKLHFSWYGQNMITAADLGKLVQTFPTKEELKQELEKVREETASKDDLRQAMTVLDKVLKEVLAMRQEQTMHVEDHRRINDRFEAIEKVPPVAPHI
ncbi:MAG: hypothetical protein ACD_19C00147G0002 [uncultured bacterium]|uniref:Uncharacterized protein n=1 Tax=Candidatus Daviesbacteria bacterium RIFCSPHIGHO2_01_FULL_40_11 TaxID=1797762 RepID=A0A1F5JGP7_9BACT|nr:MAG: hypothetical protein ACD_19C00147G0002 [uncultured bacterium]OGE27837.1 MAG: hypothetical protein A2867_01935 [Candidatus Daviesbacteria bacterium RIFCSPHIGHO2_01_FULL_40_11]